MSLKLKSRLPCAKLVMTLFTVHVFTNLFEIFIIIFDILENIKPAGMIQIRQKLTIVPKIRPNCMKKTKIPLPKNIRYRDPLLGVVADVRHLKKESGSRRIR